MEFSSPVQSFWFILWGALLVGSVWVWKAKKRVFREWAEEPLSEKIFPVKIWRKISNFKMALRLFAFFFLILSALGPRFGQQIQEIKVSSVSLEILVDTSFSMLAEDFKPNRMEKAKWILSAILERLPASRIGIIPFAGQAYVFCPLTFDLTAVKQFLKAMEPGMVPQPGTKIGEAVKLALERLSGSGSSAILLLSDGEDTGSDPIAAAKEAKEKGVPIFAVGIGSSEGEPIPQRDASGRVVGYKKDKKGEVVLSKLDEATLTEMARITQGAYFRASPTGEEIDLLAQKLEELARQGITKRESLLADRYQWFLAISLFLFLLAEILVFFQPYFLKRAGFVALSFFFVEIASLQAATFNGKMREGNRFFNQEKYPQSLESYEEALKMKPEDSGAHYNRGCALYKLGNWEEAKSEFQKSAMSKEKSLRQNSLFNLGNSHFRKGDYDAAAQSYREVLRISPNDEDAKFNLKLALKLKQEFPPNRSHPQEKKGEGKKKSSEDLAQESQARKENSKRILKAGAGEEKGKPIFKLNGKKDRKKEYEKDW